MDDGWAEKLGFSLGCDDGWVEMLGFSLGTDDGWPLG